MTDDQAHVIQGGRKRPMTGGELIGLVQTISCPNMNQAEITGGAPGPGRFVVPAGWELDCFEGGGQDIQLVEDLVFNQILEPESLSLSLSPALILETKNVRTLCLEMDKPQPTVAMKYRLLPPNRPEISKLAKLSRNSLMRGPWDQARLWIATDLASYDRMSKVLIPMVGEGTYLEEMYRCATVGAINPADSKVQAIMELRFMFAEDFSPEACAWLLAHKLRANKSGTLSWLKGQTAPFGALFSINAKKAGELAGLIGSALVREGGAEGAAAASWLLSTAVPEAHRAAAADSPGARAMAMYLMQTADENVALGILDWLAAAKPPIAALAALNMNAALPESVKARAKEVVASSPPVMRKKKAA